MIVISEIIEMFPFVLLKFIKPKDKIALIFIWYIFISFAVDMIATMYYKTYGFPYIIYQIYTPIEVFFFSYILFLIMSQDKEGRTAGLIFAILASGVVLMINILSSLKGFDDFSFFVENIIILVLSGALLNKLKFDYILFIVVGMFIYGLLNVLLFPQLHPVSNILMNISFGIALLKMM